MKTLAAIDERLNTKHGLVLNNPAYTKYYIQYGEISTYPGGYKENADAARSVTGKERACIPAMQDSWILEYRLP